MGGIGYSGRKCATYPRYVGLAYQAWSSSAVAANVRLKVEGLSELEKRPRTAFYDSER